MAKKKAAWTVMVYLAGDNNLSTECMFALTEMKKASTSERVNVIAQFDPSDPYLPTHRYEINRNRKSKPLHYDIVDRAAFNWKIGEASFRRESRQANSLANTRKICRQIRNAAMEKANLTGPTKQDEECTDETNSGSPITLYNFMSFCIEKYPAKSYMVVLSGHAAGTERDYLLKDESPVGSLTFNELKQVFKRVQQDRKGELINILGMDNCLMSMAEICYEVRGLVEVVIGCESFSPASGWPYRHILERLSRELGTGRKKAPAPPTRDIARAIVHEYVNYYADYWISGLSVTQSALNVSTVVKFRRVVDNLARAMEKQLLVERSDKKNPSLTPSRRNFQDAVLLAHWEAQSYNGEQFVDLYDFCDCLQNRIPESDTVAKQCREAKSFLESEFVLESCYCGAAYQYSYGVSVYFPWSEVASSYWNLDFVKDSKRGGWGSFLRTYTLLTRREPRGATSDSKLGAALEAAVEARLTTVRMINDRLISDRMISDRMISDRMIGDRARSDRMINDRMIDDRMGSVSCRCRVHSMRNPPNAFFPDECIKDPAGALDGQEILLLG